MRWRSLGVGVLVLAAGWVGLAAWGCKSESSPEAVVLYSSIDEPFLREVVAAFERKTGIRVDLKGDAEAGKTTGLVRRIRAERSRPRADVFWSSELFNTILLAQEGLLAEYRPPAEGIPDRFKDPEGRWTAFGVRGRVIGYNTTLVQPEELPTTWRELADTRWQGRLGFADPQFGTTGGHVAAMYVLWGEEDYVSFLQALRPILGGQLQDGNATAARRVGRGELALCATDTDDVVVRQINHEPVNMVYPDMGDGGTLFIPCSVGLITGGPNPEGGRRLIDFLVSAEVEHLLALSDSRNIPVRASLRQELGMEMPPESKVDFEAVAEVLDKAIQLARQHLLP